MPTDVSTFSEVITASTSLVTDFGMMPFIAAAAVVSAAAYLYRRFKAASK